MTRFLYGSRARPVIYERCTTTSASKTHLPLTAPSAVPLFVCFRARSALYTAAAAAAAELITFFELLHDVHRAPKIERNELHREGSVYKRRSPSVQSAAYGIEALANNTAFSVEVISKFAISFLKTVRRLRTEFKLDDDRENKRNDRRRNHDYILTRL